MLWYLHLCAVNQIVVVGYQDHATGVMKEVEDCGGQFQSVTLHPHVTIAAGSNHLTALQLHSEAHKLCYIARSVNFPVHHVPEVAEAI